MRLDLEPEIARMASELKADTSGGAVAGILQFCKRKLRNWISEAGYESLSLSELQDLVCRKLRLVFEEVRTDLDLHTIIGKYVALGEPVFATLKTDLNDQTFAALLERHNVNARSDCRYVAVIDCRGDKAHRRFFTKWHEIAHLLTLTRQLELPFHRSTTDRSPTERLMDVIAGELGFPEEVMRSPVNEEIALTGRLTFRGVERIRGAACPEASFQATLNACIARWPQPVILVEAGMGHKKSERARLQSRQLSLIPRQAPAQKLRALTAGSNEAARKARFRIDPSMAVPAESVVARRFYGEEVPSLLDDGSVVEDLSIWRHSDGTAVGSGPVRIETRSIGNRIWALIQPQRQRG
jgi:hypothetical protein